MMKNYPAMEWDLDYFKDNWGDSEITVHRGNIINKQNKEQEHIQMKLGEFVDWIKLHEKVMEEDEFDGTDSSYYNAEDINGDIDDWDVNQVENYTSPDSVDYTRIPYWAEGGNNLDELSIVDGMNEFPMMKDFASTVDVYFWMGPPGARTGMHADLDPFGYVGV